MDRVFKLLWHDEEFHLYFDEMLFREKSVRCGARVVPFVADVYYRALVEGLPVELERAIMVAAQLLKFEKKGGLVLQRERDGLMLASTHHFEKRFQTTVRVPFRESYRMRKDDYPPTKRLREVVHIALRGTKTAGKRLKLRQPSKAL